MKAYLSPILRRAFETAPEWSKKELTTLVYGDTNNFSPRVQRSVNQNMLKLIQREREKGLPIRYDRYNKIYLLEER